MNRLNLSLVGVRRAVTTLTAGLAIAASVAACGSSSDTGPGAATDTTVTDTQADTTTGTDAVSTGNDTTAKPDVAKDTIKADIQTVVDNDNTPETAQALTVASTAAPGNPSSDTLDPTGDIDYWSFQGKKGDITYIYIQAQALTTAFDPDTLDTVITLYGPDKKQIAFDDDPIGRANNDSELLTYLPADGTYYVRVEECWTWLAEHPEKTGVSCADPKDKSNTDYNIGVITFVDSDPGIVVEIEKGDTITEATEVPWEKDTQGKYVSPTMVGTFKGIVDIDVYHFNVPTDITVSQGRSSIDFTLATGGVDGNGSTAVFGTAWLASEATPTAQIANVDLSTSDTIGPPITFGKGYYLYVIRASGAFTTNEFYFIDAFAGGSNPVETNESGNDVATGAESVKVAANSGSQSGYLEGDLIKGGADVDWWSVAVPTGFGGGALGVYCGAQSVGSGLRGFKVDLYSDAGKTAITGGSQVEPAAGVAITTLKSTADGTTLYLKFSATSQAADVSSSYYRCGVVFQAP